MKLIALKENYSAKIHMVRPESIQRIEYYPDVHAEIWFNNGAEKIVVDKCVDIFETLRRAGMVDMWTDSTKPGAKE